LKYSFYILNILFFRFLPDSLYFNFIFFLNCIRLNKKYYYLNLKHPQTFNEHVLNSKTHDIEKKSIYADKLNVKDLIESKNLNFPKTLVIFSKKSGIRNFDFSILAKDGFIIKANHGSGLNRIYKGGNTPVNRDILNIEDWFSNKSQLNSREEHYNRINKKVFIEELLHENIEDYKFHCFGGKVKFIQIDVDRFINHKRNFYDINWNLQNWEINYAKCERYIPRPSNLSEMIRISEEIAVQLKFSEYLRVDLYENNNLIYFGEVTFHPGGGVEPFDSYESDLYMGSFFKL
jgi:hypothetical protein